MRAAASSVAVRLRTLDPPWEKLRISVIDACNYACTFCHNEGQVPVGLKQASTMSYRDFETLVIAAGLERFKRVKLTGGEPLLYEHRGKSIADLCLAAKKAAPHARISLTTNGQLLARHAQGLAESGLSHVTVSVHTTRSDDFARLISSSGSPSAQFSGVASAVEAGLKVKANVVVLRETARGVPSLVDRLFDTGVSIVRLYRYVWSPYAKSTVRFSLDNLSFAGVVTRASGSLGEEISEDVAHFLGRESQKHEALLIPTARGWIEVDKLAGSVAGGAMDEGDYAVRVGSDLSLRSTLFGDWRDVTDAVRSSRVTDLRREFREARRKIKNV